MNITPHPIRIAVAAALSALVLAVSFGGPALLGDDGDRASASENVSAARSTSADGADDPSDGSFFGRIVAAYVGPAEIVFDRRELLVGSEARAAASADGSEPTDYYIRDAGDPRTTLPVDDSVTVSRVLCDDEGCAEGQPQSYDDFTMTFAEQGEPSGDRYFRIVVEDGSVIRIDERYFA